MKKVSFKTLRNSALVTTILILIIAFLVPVENNIKGPGRFVARAEWTLVQIEQDKLQSNLICNGPAKNDDISLFHFARPDYIQLSLASNLAIGDTVQAGVTVAQLYSTEDEIRFSALKGELEEARANLSAFNTGEKEALQEEGQMALEYARKEFAAYEPVYARQKALYEKKLISLQELELAQAQYDLLKINISLQEARLKAAKTGAKAEEVAVIEHEIKAAADQLEILEKKIQAGHITTPITGVIVEPDRSLGELVHICQLDTMILQMPVKATHVKYVKPGQNMTAFVYGSRHNRAETRVERIDRNARIIAGQPMYLISAPVANRDGTILNGMNAYIKIHAGQVNAWQMLIRAWDTFRFNR